MGEFDIIGKSVLKKESQDKVTGAAKYTADSIEVGLLHVRLVASPYAHARIRLIDTSEARKILGVRAILIGKDYPVLTGEAIRDRPIIAIDKVRYHGETVAVVVADSEYIAECAAARIRIDYEPLPVVNSPIDALKPNSPLIHKQLETYERLTDDVHPKPGTNIAHLVKIRKGDLQKGWSESEVIIEETISFPQSDHSAMETRSALAEIKPDGTIIIFSSSQAPFAIKKYLGTYFNIDKGKIIVHTPLVGGAYGGKAAIQLELIAYLASKAVGGRKVRLVNTREEDMITSPVHIGLQAKLKLGSTKEGKIRAAELIYWFDGGAYSDKAVDIAISAATGCTGPYHMENLYCDSICVYTNHPYATAWRGYGFTELTFAVERAMDRLAEKMKMDPLELRWRNAIRPGDLSPTQVLLNRSTVGNLPRCIEKLRELIHWEERKTNSVSGEKVRSMGISCFWKNSSFDPDASSGVILTFNRDGSINLISGVVEIGTGTKTVLAQVLAEKMKMDVNKVHVKFHIDTRTTPEHWKTVGSRGTWLAGRAALIAADDVIRQLK
jgi:CO/xanthine dehydrogenase Mo-binding subunit